MLTKEEVAQIFNERPRKFFKKKGQFLFRPAIPGETIMTIVAGRLETFKKASEKDIVIRNIEIGSSAEVYIISGEKFEKIWGGRLIF
jgi:hypothetical protein